MKLFSAIVEILFPPSFSKQDLTSIPSAPEPAEEGVFALFDYHHSKGKRLIYDLKRREERVLSKHIASLMAEHLAEYLADQGMFGCFVAPVIVPLPLSRKSHKTRGFNQNNLMARHLAHLVGGTYEPGLLIKTKETKKQALIKSRRERYRNVKESMRVSDDRIHLVRNRDVILVDDLVTSGATIGEAKRALEKAGARNIIAVTVGH